MKFRNLTIIFLLLVFAGGLLFTASVQLDDINKSRKELKLVSNEPLENAPPSLAFATVAMGAFRGLVVDILWMRADKLKEEGQFFDAKQLAEWITVLQPRFATVWDFQAWNMAYNISVAMPSSQPAERWKWVKNGYELLRDKGIPKNPKSILLYRSLAWIFQHKMGGVTDDVNRYYKIQLALSMRPLISPNTNEHFERLAAAPETLTELLKDEKVAAFINALKKADENFNTDEESAIVKNYLSLVQVPKKYSDDAAYLIESAEEAKMADAMQKLDDFAKAWELRNTWKFDIKRMIRVNKQFGPVDYEAKTGKAPLNWEHPDAHAIYWAIAGLEIAGDTENLDINEVNTDRIVVHSLQSLYRTGKIFIFEQKVQRKPDARLGETEPVTEIIQTCTLRPDQRMFDSYDAAIRSVIAKYEKYDKANVRPHRNGHRNMLNNAILSLYQAGHMKKAAQVFKELRTLYPRPENNMPLEMFCRKRIQEELESLGIHDAVELVINLLREAYFRYSLYEDGEAAGREKMARDIYEHYQFEMYEEEVDRVNLPDFSRLRYMALNDFLYDQTFPNDIKQNLLNRIKLERPELFESIQAESQKLKQEMQQKQQNQ